MIPISSSAPRSVASPAVRETERAREARPASPAESGPLKPIKDKYVPEGEKKRESYGRYWLGKDENGDPKIYFDDPEAKAPAAAEDAPQAAEDASRAPEAPRPEDPDEKPAVPGKPAPAGKKEEVWRGNTDAVDREIEKLKEKRAELERQISRETDETKREALERRLSQVENELRQKDNDAYRRQHAVVTRIS